MNSAAVSNTLLRCTRKDRLAAPEFEFVRADLELRVRELPEGLDDIVQDLSEIREKLRDLAPDSSDYTLHLVATVDELHSLKLPPELLRLAGDCGFGVEISTALLDAPT